MMGQRICGNLEDIILQVLQRGNTGYLLFCLRVTEDEIPEAHVLLHQMMQVHIHLRRVLIDEMEAFSLGLLTIGRLL